MKHYFKWSTHIVIGLIIIILALLLWYKNVWAPRTNHNMQAPQQIDTH